MRKYNFYNKSYLQCSAPVDLLWICQ